jgi:hypothetical protein
MSNKMSSSLKNYMNGSVKNEIRNEVTIIIQFNKKMMALIITVAFDPRDL